MIKLYFDYSTIRLFDLKSASLPSKIQLYLIFHERRATMNSANGLTVQQVLHHLLPEGTRGTPEDFGAVPLWPLDLFGVAAYLVQQLDCHTRLLEHGLNGIGTQFSLVKDELVDAGWVWRYVSDIDSDYNRSNYPSVERIHQYWAILLRHGNCPLHVCGEVDEIVIALLALIAIADEASYSVGFFLGSKPKKSTRSGGATLWIPAVFDYATNGVEKEKLLPHFGTWYAQLKPNSHWNFANGEPLPTGCLMIPEDRLCVLPKSHTPALGCTLRSLTHNLALHPSATQIESRWYNYQRFGRYKVRKSLNILIVPIPYRISPDDFVGHELQDSTYHGFTIRQSWLDRNPEAHAQDIRELIDQCAREKTLPDVIVFPEAALNREYHHAILEQLASDERLPQLIVIAGLSDGSDHQRNYSLTAYLSRGKIVLKTGQMKHHRWKLDKNQIDSYALASSLSAEHIWWELSTIGERSVGYHMFGNGASIASLICEDLARTDPCKPSINASAPNLVFALLMDGPQVASRWPGRYALGLADDPGSAVLTVTSVGLIERSNWRYNNVRQTIALWGGADGVRELDLPAKKDALILTIEKREESRVSLDGRVSASKAIGWSYKGHKAISRYAALA